MASTIPHGGAGRGATASQATAPSLHDHHQGGAACSAFRRLRHGRVGPYQFQFAGADAPRQRPVSRNLLPRGIGQHLPGCAFVAAPGLFIQHARCGSSRPVVHSTPRQRFSQCGADMVHFLNLRLSSSPSSDGFKTIEKALTYGAQPLPSRGKIYD